MSDRIRNFHMTEDTLAGVECAFSQREEKQITMPAPKSITQEESEILLLQKETEYNSVFEFGKAVGLLWINFDKNPKVGNLENNETAAHR